MRPRRNVRPARSQYRSTPDLLRVLRDRPSDENCPIREMVSRALWPTARLGPQLHRPTVRVGIRPRPPGELPLVVG